MHELFPRWHKGNTEMAVYEYKKEHKNRLGHCDWLPTNGDLCICIEHSGDYFDNYIAIRKLLNGKYKKVGEFGAYWFGKKLFQLKNKNIIYCLLEKKLS